PQMALLQLHKRKTPHLPPPSTWNTKRRQLRSVRSNRRPIAVIIDGAENPRSQPHHQIPPLVSSALICARAFSQAASLHRRQVLFYINNGASRIQNEIVESVLQGEI